MPKPNGKSPKLIPLSRFEADLDAEDNGVWCDLKGDYDGLRVLARSPNCPDYLRRLGKLNEQFIQSQGADAYDALAQQELTNRAIADVLILDWEGFGDDAGNPLPIEKKVEVMTERRWHFVAGAIRVAINVAHSMKPRSSEGVRKNSETPSATVSA